MGLHQDRSDETPDRDQPRGAGTAEAAGCRTGCCCYLRRTNPGSSGARRQGRKALTDSLVSAPLAAGIAIVAIALAAFILGAEGTSLATPYGSTSASKGGLGDT